MRKGYLKKAAILSFLLLLAASSTVFASANAPVKKDSPPNSQTEQSKFKFIGRNDDFSKLLDQLGLKKEDIKSARDSNKSLFDLAKTKGYSQDQVRKMFIKIKTDSINQAVSEGKLTREQGNDAIKKMSEKMSSWDGSLKFRGKGHNFHKLHSLSYIKELGVSEQDILNAQKSGKNFFTLVKEKNGMTPNEIKSIIIKNNIDAINKRVSEGGLTKEKAELIIPRMKAKIESWDGSLKAKD